jgi:hypothetical protein
MMQTESLLSPLCPSFLHGFCILEFYFAALLDPFVTSDQNCVSDSAAGESYERKFD